jgi:hypothetical protein
MSAPDFRPTTTLSAISRRLPASSFFRRPPIRPSALAAARPADVRSRIVEHYTDTAGATDHVFGLCHMLGYRFAPWIKDLKDRKLYTVEKPGSWPLLEPLIGDTIDTAAILGQWTELMRLKASIEARRGRAVRHPAQTGGGRCR